MNTLLVLNDPPYGTERCYNGPRLAHSLRKNDPDGAITVFLMGDAVIGAQTNQTTPDGYYNMERMLKRLLTGRGKVLSCGTCMDARGVSEAQTVDGAARGTMDELADATLTADKVLVF